MTTTFPVDNRNILDECDSTSGWTATDGPTLFTASPDPIEDSGCLAMQVSNTTENAYTSITSDDYSGGGTLSVWIQDRAEFDVESNTGIGIVVGDGTNRIAYAVGGSDGTAFRHDTGPVKWACFLLDIANKPANFVALAGSEASLNEAAITQVGVYFSTLVKSVGGADNCFWDIIRFADNGDDVVMQGGTTSGAAGNGSEAAAVDRGTGNQQAYGVIRELASGVYGIQGNLTVGNSASSSDQYWTETNVTYAWEDRGLSSNNYYRFVLIGSSTATNCEVSFTACSFVVPSAASASFDGNGADLTVCTVTDSTFIGFDQGIETSDDTGDDWTGNTYVDCDQVVANGCDLSDSTFSGYTGAANTSYLAYNLAADPDGELDDLTFTMSGTNHHAIEFGADIVSPLTLRGCDFSGFSASQNNDASIFHFLDTTGSITLNLVDCTSDVAFTNSYRTAGATITIAESVSVSITIVDQAGDPIQDVRVSIYLESDDSEVMNTLTNASGVASTTFSGATPADVYIRWRKSSTGSTRYFPDSSTGTIAAGTGLASQFVMRVDNIASP